MIELVKTYKNDSPSEIAISLRRELADRINHNCKTPLIEINYDYEDLESATFADVINDLADFGIKYGMIAMLKRD